MTTIRLLLLFSLLGVAVTLGGLAATSEGSWEGLGFLALALAAGWGALSISPKIFLDTRSDKG